MLGRRRRGGLAAQGINGNRRRQWVFQGQYLFNGDSVYSPWMGRQADNIRFTVDLIAQTGDAKVKVEIFQKNSETNGNGAEFSSDSNLKIETSSPGRTVFGFEDGQLKVLLLEMWDGKWALPGGFIHRTESVNESVRRVLKERTQLSNIYLKQFYTFGESNRDYSKEIQKAFGYEEK